MSKQDIKINIKNKEKINILITHADLDKSSNDGREYNPISSKELKNSEFDYIALGHIHKKSYKDYENQKIVYPGSTISQGFDELGSRGFIDGRIDEITKKLTIQFIKTDAKTFEEKEIDVTQMLSSEELIENINEMKFDDCKYYKIILIGKRSFNIDEKEILSLLNVKNIIRIRNHTQIKYEIEEIASKISLKGLFAKDILEKLNNETDEEEKEKLLNAFEIGMDILK